MSFRSFIEPPFVGPAMLVGIGLLVSALSLPHPAASSEASRKPATPSLPEYQDPEQLRQESVQSIWNALGSLQANLGGRERLSIRATEEPGVFLEFNRREGTVRVRAGEDLLTEGETSIELLLERVDGAWVLAGAEVMLNLRNYYAEGGEITIHRLDEHRGVLEATFSFQAQTKERLPRSLRVRDGSLRINLP